MAWEQRKPGRDRHLLSPDDWEAVARSLRLSAREIEIVQCIFDGRSEPEIAAAMGISPHTVHSHLERLHRKLDVHCRTALVIRVFAAHPALQRTGSAERPGI